MAWAWQKKQEEEEAAKNQSSLDSFSAADQAGADAQDALDLEFSGADELERLDTLPDSEALAEERDLEAPSAALQKDLPPDLLHILFPHDKVRASQDDLIRFIDAQLKDKANAICHAPTGLGKTAAALAPALPLAQKENLTIFFLTSRHTQHRIVLETLKRVQKRHGAQFPAVSIIGKKWLCLQGGIDKLPSREFMEFCRAMREDGKCAYYDNLRRKDKKDELSTDAKAALGDLSRDIRTTEEVIQTSQRHTLCPYEISMLLAKKARVIICDYQYLFNPTIRETFLKKLEKELEKSIIIVDEAHNLPSRVKDLSSSVCTSIMLRRALSEARKFHFEDVEHWLKELDEILTRYGMAFEQRSIQDAIKGPQSKASPFLSPDEVDVSIDYGLKERYIQKDDFLEQVNRIAPIGTMIKTLYRLADQVREEQKQSFLGSIADFLNAWQGDDAGFVRIFSFKEGIKEKVLMLAYRCLDPSLSGAPVLNGCYASVLMSGTLTPTSMYKELLGVTRVKEAVFKSPFPRENKLSLIIPKTSTKYAGRSRDQYVDIAQTLAGAVNAIPGNVAVFFPSYYLRDQVAEHFSPLCPKTVFSERPEMSKLEKHEFLEQFKRYKQAGAVLLGVITGSFAEGIDLPGEELVGVVVVGLPLAKPDLETKALIKYYDDKFGRGWDYGYVGPAFNKTFQSAGRCIRTETDRGVVVFLDERYAWPQYFKYFPAGEAKITLLPIPLIKDFFKK